MKTQLLAFAAVAALVAGSGAASAQQAAGNYAPPRTAWGKPELSGVWTNSSLTTLQRPANAKTVVITQEEHAKVLAHNQYAMMAKDEAGPPRSTRSRATSCSPTRTRTAATTISGSTQAMTTPASATISAPHGSPAPQTA
jgi:hypothetical protein